MRIYILLFLYILCSCIALSQQEELDAIIKSGLVTTLEKLQAQHYPMIEISSENAAFFFDKAFTMMNDNNDFSKLQKIISDDPFSNETQKDLLEYIEKNKLPLEEIYKGTQKNFCRFKINFTFGYSTVLPPFIKMMKSLVLLQSKAILHIAKKEKQEAIDATVAMLKLARFHYEIPCLISPMIAIRMQSTALSTMEILIGRLSLDQKDISVLKVALEDLEKVQSLEKSFTGEMCMGIEIFERLLAGKSAPEISMGKAGLWWYRITGGFGKEYRKYLTIMHDVIKLTKLPLKKRVSELPKLEASLQEISSSSYHICSMLIPALNATVKTELEAILKSKAALLSLAVESYRIENASLPEKLQDIIPKYLTEIPQDPYSGNDFAYQKEENGYRIYSFGPDKQDNHGKSKQEAAYKQSNWDIPFAVKK
ncbi:MAG: hypothetical protein HUU50_21670 [Candidatus Brocadiae bacterium]|nr:hypothetical protein [Candidatus Brocadiia bacterium]